jgi:GTPase SAR1 family protein
MDKLNEEGDKQALVVIVGNKVDYEGDREVSESEGVEFAKSHDAAYFEVSAHNGYNIQEMFSTLINEIYKRIKELESQTESIAGTHLSKSASRQTKSSIYKESTSSS